MPAVGGPGDQFTDYNPGIKPSGLFWTIPFDASTFDATPGQGRARFRVDNVPMPDYHDIGNSLSPNPTSIPGHVSFEVTWAGGGDRQQVRDSTFDFAASLVTGPATITFTASDDGSSAVYTADREGQSNPLDPGVGHERNGVFFQ
jgi:hypothetical protein